MENGWGKGGWGKSNWGSEDSIWDDKRREEWAKYKASEGKGRGFNENSFFGILSRIQNAYAWEKKVIESEFDKSDLQQFMYNFRATEYWDWFKFAMKHGFVEVFMFLLLIPPFLLAQLGIIKVFSQVDNRFVVSIFSYVLLFSVNFAYTSLYIYLSKFVIGDLTRRMFSPLAWGRAVPLFLKALLLVGVSFFLTNKYLTPDVVWKVSHYLHFIADKGVTTGDIYYRIYGQLPSIRRDFLGSALILAAFGTIPLLILKFKKNVKFGSFAWIKAVSKAKCKLHDDKVKERKIHVGCGLEIYPELPSGNYRKHIKPVFQTDAERGTHTDVIGTTGVGKTRLAESLIEQDIKMGNSVIVVDPKTDWELFSRTWSAAVENNRTEDFIFISLLHPHLSSGINPLKYYVYPDEVISTMVSTIQAKEEFFVNIAREMATLIVQGLYYLHAQETGRRKQFSYSEILRYISQDGLKKIADQLKAYKDQDPEKVESLLENYNQAIKSPPDYFNKVVSTLRTNVANFAHGVVGSVVGKADDNKVIERLESGQRVICYVMTGSQAFKDKANQLSRVLLAMLDNLAGRLNASGMKLPYPLRVHVDEAYTAMYHGIESLFDKGRSTGIGLVFYHQSIGQFVEAVGENLTETIFDNINTFFVMRVKKDETQEFAAKMAGQRLGALPTFSADGHAGMFPNEGFRIPPDRFTDFPMRVGLFVRQNAIGENSSKLAYILKTPDVKEPKIKVTPQDLRSVTNEREIVELLKRYV